MRQMAFMKVNFKDEPKITESKDAEGEKVQKTRAAEDVFLQEFYQHNIDKYAQYYVQYLKFKELVTVDPLMPDKHALNEISALEKQGDKLNAMLEEHEA